MEHLGGRARSDPAAWMPATPNGGQPSDAEIVARAARIVHRAIVEDLRAAGVEKREPNRPLHDLCLDLRVVLVRSPAGRAVLQARPSGPDPVDVLTGERDMALRDRNEALAQLAEIRQAYEQERADHAETRRELITANEDRNDVVEAIEALMPESWDSDAAATAIAVEFVGVLAARVQALGGSSERHPERTDGTPFPDARIDPNGYADAVAEWRRHHSGCRCTALGKGAPEHAESFLCKPGPGDRRCFEHGLFGCTDHTPDPVLFTDPWAGLDDPGRAR